MVLEPDSAPRAPGSRCRRPCYRGTEVVDTRGLRGGARAACCRSSAKRLRYGGLSSRTLIPLAHTLRFEAQSKGAAVWFRGEGAWFHNGEHYFVCSNAGDAGEGQVWCYDPRREPSG